MNSTPSQPFSNPHDPDLGHLVDDFLVELDRILRPPPVEQEKKAGKR